MKTAQQARPRSTNKINERKKKISSVLTQQQKLEASASALKRSMYSTKTDKIEMALWFRKKKKNN